MSAKFRFVFLAVFSLAVVLSAARLEHTTYTAYLRVDTLNDTTSGTGISYYQDTFKIIRMVWDNFEVSGIDLWVKIDTSITDTMITAQGLGLSDSGYIWIYAVNVMAGVEYFVLVDSVANAGVPCSLHVLVTVDSTLSGTYLDSMWKEYWSLVYRIADTASDTVMNPTYVIWVDYKLIGK